MFTRVHLAQEEGWRLDKATIAIHDSLLSTQRKQGGIMSPNKIIVDISLARRLEAEDLIKNIRDIGHQINLESSIPLIINLKIN